MTPFVEAVCAREFDARPDRVEHLSTGNVKQTAVVELPDDRTLVVQWSEADLSSEAAVVRELGDRTDVPIPRLVGEGTFDGRTYFVTEFVPGANLHTRLTTFDPDDRRRIIRDLGARLAAVHRAFRFSGHGPVAAVDGTLAVDHPRDWPEYLGELFAEGLEELPPALSDLRSGIEAAYEPSALPSAPPARLYPWDFRPGNVVVRDAGIAALLDWGDPRSAHREFSLAKTEYCTVDWYGQREHRDAFLAGYESVFPLPDGYEERRRQYRLVAIVRSAVTDRGSVTRPGYPMIGTEAAIAFHRRALEAIL